MAKAKASEAAHPDQRRSDRRVQFEPRRHMQHVTNEALNATRGQLAAAERDIEHLRQEAIGLLTETAHLSEETGRLGGELRQSQRELADMQATSAARQARLEQLDTELKRMKASRSWRWTAWLRTLERALRRRQQ